jgi:hypothetical protein
MVEKMPYAMLFTLNGKYISGVYGDYPDDAAAIAQARMYFRSSAADTLYLHRGNGFFPLGELVIELTKQKAA